VSKSRLACLLKASDVLVNVTDAPRLEAEILLAFVLNEPRSALHAWPEKTLNDEQLALFASYLERRTRGEPMAYLMGRRAFWSQDLMVTSHTLIPRPETELMVEEVLLLTKDKLRGMKVADLGTGSGAIALALAHERPSWEIYATDISEEALQIARKNAQQLGLKNVSFYQGNWCTALPCSDFDIIVSNPPYIAETEWADYAEGLAFEPRLALVSGQDGLEALQDIGLSAKNYLHSSGYLLMEHGFSQGAAVRHLLALAGFEAIRTVRDLAGQERMTLGRLA
jgi:release factor glutamine methyltransferase